jgi:CBS domain-containing protein
MQTADIKISQIANELDSGAAPAPETARSILYWFGFNKRGWRVIRAIRAKFEHYGVKMTPDIESAYIDSYVRFSKSSDTNINDDDCSGPSATDPTFRVGRLESAHSKPITVKPDAKLEQAVTLMLTNDYSQLPVMTTDRDVKGIISWKTIGTRIALGKECYYVRECMESAQIVSINDSLFSAIDRIADHDYVLVQDTDKTISGIITASDFNQQFRQIAEPFMLVGEIENGVRNLLKGKFSSVEIQSAKAPGDDTRSIEAISDLTFGEYIRLIESEARWKKLNLAIDRVAFIERLNSIREIRNDVMHFDPEGLSESDMATLREFAQFLKRLRDIGVI